MSKVYLKSCPFSEKDAVKKAGARWDAQERKWYVPPNRMDSLELFNKWRPKGRMYLNCSYQEKDRAKEKGAKWDKECKKWYFIPSKDRTEAQFTEWLVGSHNHRGNASKVTPTEQSPGYHKSSRKKAQKKKDTDAQDKRKVTAHPTREQSKKVSTPLAILPRINEDMTISELQSECRARNPSIKGLSNKNKPWLLGYLGIGSVWVAAPNMSEKKSLDPSFSIETTAFSPKKIKMPSKSKDESGTKKRKLKSTQQDENNKKSKKKHVQDAPSSPSSSSLLTYPKVSTSLTVDQLRHEMHHRNPSVKGTSNKSKQWFLDQLGVESIWTSSPDAKVDWTSYPKVTDSMTIPQLSYELLSRNPAQKGMSGKNKNWFLEKLGVGSVWTTGKGIASSSVKTAKSSSNNKAASIKNKQVPSSKVPSDKIKVKPVQKDKGQSTVSSTKSNKRAPKLEPRSSTYSSVHLSQQQIKEEKVKKVERKNIDALVPDAPVSSSRVSTSQKTKKKSKPTVCNSSTKVPPAPANPKSNKALSTIKKEVSVLPTPIASSSQQPAVPLVTKVMTISQLKEECKVRDRDVACSSKNKTWLLEYLGVGSELEGSAEWMAKKKRELNDLHIHKSNCHCHPLADSRQLPHSLRFPNGTRSNVRRNIFAECDIGHKYICTNKVFRTCLDCDFDICKACFEVECLPEQEKRAYLTNKYEQIQEANRLAEEARRQQYERDRIERIQEEKRRKEKLKRKYKRYLAKFSDVVKHPKPENLDRENRLKYTVWKSFGYDNDGWHSYEGPPEKNFDSSFDSLDEANQRVKYVFYFKNDWGFEKNEMHAEANCINQDGMRFMQCRPDDSERWTVSVVPSSAFEFINFDTFNKSDWNLDPNPNKYSHNYHDHYSDQKALKKALKEFHPSIINPSPRNTDTSNKLKYTIWKSYKGSKDRYEGICDRDFDSSYDSLHEANQRVKYVFFFKEENGYGDEEPYVEIDATNKKVGIRFMSTGIDDYGREWSVSAIPSEVFKFIQHDIGDESYHRSSNRDTVGSYFGRGTYLNDQSSEEESDHDDESSVSNDNFLCF